LPDLSPPRRDQSFVTGALETPIGPIPTVGDRLTPADRWGAIKVRWDIGRMSYKVDPGLYALGHPDAQSPVLVTANYKLSFDWLRGSLPGRSAWLLALDTDGVNVWCAAGKGTFGTEELVQRVRASRVAEVVSHRHLILPQLGAPGVAAHLLHKQCGFHAKYGPIKAEDLPAFLNAGHEATREMRRKSFTLRERVAVVPVELVMALKYGVPVALALFFLAGLGWPGGYLVNLVGHGLLAVTAYAGAILAGAVLTPLLLPWVPGSAFSAKGFVVGLIVAVIHAVFWWSNSEASSAAVLEIAGALLFGPAFAAFLAMNFTGASTFTSLSGVRKEMRWAVPLEIAGVVAGLALWVSSRFVA
jgi:acetyl-CoA decarbonylase/synthase complex subunit gamma